jgi:predicted hotdog family 3-hydroxylacyl-ACP dehydratase
LKLPSYRIEELLPHARPMILLDEVTDVGEGTLSAALTVRPGRPFFEAGRGVAAHVAIEWMAQTCGAYVGVAALEAGQPIRMGWLLGTRNFQATVPWFREGERLNITVTPAFLDSQMGAFDCIVTRAGNGDEVAKARLTLYHPDDAATLPAAPSTGTKE